MRGQTPLSFMLISIWFMEYAERTICYAAVCLQDKDSAIFTRSQNSVMCVIDLANVVCTEQNAYAPVLLKITYRCSLAKLCVTLGVQHNMKCRRTKYQILGL